MTETINEQRDEQAASAPTDAVDDRQLAGQLVEQARAEGLRLTGSDGLLGRLTRLVLESALQAELTEHVGYEPHELGRRRQHPRRQPGQDGAHRHGPGRAGRAGHLDITARACRVI